MPRMIYADVLTSRLKTIFCKECKETFGCVCCPVGDYFEEIDDTPTIDAIPVNEFCKWLDECGCNIFKEAFVINVQLFRAAMEKGE